jgi:hypothetical protein
MTRITKQWFYTLEKKSLQLTFLRQQNTMNKKTSIYFGPPLERHTQDEKNTLMKSGRINRTAERYMAILDHHGLTLTTAEATCLKQICHIGYMSPLEITELSMDVRAGVFDIPDLDTQTLANKLDQASFADLVATVESLGF